MNEDKRHGAVPLLRAGDCRTRSLENSDLREPHLWISIMGRARSYRGSDGRKRPHALGCAFVHERSGAEALASKHSIDGRTGRNRTPAHVFSFPFHQ